ncbi:MAG: ribosome maturation factor RimP [Dongiaceae bacterium]
MSRHDYHKAESAKHRLPPEGAEGSMLPAVKKTPAEIEALLESQLSHLGYRLVLFRLIGGKNRPTMQIMTEHQDGKPISLDECATVSRHLSAVFEVEETMPGSYILEVSSPGIDRPLRTLKDFQRHAGYEIKASTKMPQNGRRNFKGVLKAISGNAIIMAVDGIEYNLALEDIASAQLVLSEDLLKRKG